MADPRAVTEPAPRLRILTTLNYYRPHWTGLSIYAANIAEGLAARGHEVSVIASRHSPDLARDEVLNRVRVRRLRVLARVSRTMVMPGFIPSVWRAIRDHDVVHVHSPSPEAALVVAMARLRRRRVVVTHQGDVVMPAGWANRLVHGVMTIALRFATRQADAVVTHNADYARHSRFLAPARERLHAIYPPTTIPVPDHDRAASWRRELGVEGCFVVGFAGRFVHEKGFDVLLDAIDEIVARRPDARFVFAGETDVVYEDLFQRCAPLVERHSAVLRLIGLVTDRGRLADFYAMCDVFVLPSRSDCFAAVQVEAMLCGTPVIASDIPGARSVITATGNGVLVEPERPHALADAIVAAADAPLTSPTRSRIESIFSVEDTIDRYEDVLRGGASASTTVAPPAALQKNGPLLASPDLNRVSTLTANETDMAYRRRIPTMMGWLDLRDGDVVLDCGCGMGYLSAVMSKLRDVTVVGVDGDIDRLRWAAAEHVDSARAVVAIEHLPFPDATFDKVLLSEVLEHLADDVDGLVEIRRVLKPGGVLCLSVPHANYPPAWDPFNAALETFGWPPMRSAGPITGQWSNHERLYLPADLERALARGGFSIEAMAEQTSRTVPLNHVLVYSLGKPLIEKGLLPRRMRDASDRFRSEDNATGSRNPINLARRCLVRFDARNDRLDPRRERHFVSLLARATPN